jgi:hypothetical protein
MLQLPHNAVRQLVNERGMCQVIDCGLSADSSQEGRKKEEMSLQKHKTMEERRKGQIWAISGGRCTNDALESWTWLALVTAKKEEPFDSITDHGTSEVVPCSIAQLGSVPDERLDELERQ